MVKRRSSDLPQVHVLRAELLGLAPPIWRRVPVPSAGTLCLLNQVLQASFEWSDDHLHEFVAGSRTFRHDPRDPRHGNEHDVTLADVLPRRGSQLQYTYDFGDNWQVRVTVQSIDPVSWADGGAERPRLLGGARAAPPEDCGGVGLYALLCEASLDPAHPQRDELLEPFDGQPIDPEAFDLVRVARAVAREGASWGVDEEGAFDEEDVLDLEEGEEDEEEEREGEAAEEGPE